ncbi:radical SAM protein [bacterium]|nr:MAG: radical SAM protein [bacterium]
MRETTVMIIVLVTSDCNLQCSYCYTRASRRNIESFDVNNIKTLIKNSSIGFDNVEFYWHGGEPLLVGKEFYTEVLRCQQEEKRERKIKFRNKLQTNGMLIDTAWMDFFRKIIFMLALVWMHHRTFTPFIAK